MDKKLIIDIVMYIVFIYIGYRLYDALRKKQRDLNESEKKEKDFKFCIDVIKTFNSNIGKRVGIDRSDATKERIKLLFDMGYVLTSPEDDKSVLLTNALQVHKREYKKTEVTTF